MAGRKPTHKGRPAIKIEDLRTWSMVRLQGKYQKDVAKECHLSPVTVCHRVQRVDEAMGPLECEFARHERLRQKSLKSLEIQVDPERALKRDFHKTNFDASKYYLSATGELVERQAHTIDLGRENTDDLVQRAERTVARVKAVKARLSADDGGTGEEGSGEDADLSPDPTD